MGVNIPPNVAKGLRDIYGPTGRTVHAYSNTTGSIRYLALRPEDKAPDVFPSATDHKRVGVVDFVKMKIVEAGGGERATESEVPDFVGMAIKLVGGIILLCIAIVFAIIGLSSALSSKSR